MDKKIVFMGTPEFALPTLSALANNYPIAGTVTQPDRPSGRGRKLKPPPVKILSQELGLPIIQPKRLSLPGVMEQLRQWNPDLIVVAAYGNILKPELLELPRYGCINVHASLLPRWRGAAPVQAAILHGDVVTGVTIMVMDPGMDTGPIIDQKETPILENDTGGTLSMRLSKIGAELLIDTLPAYFRGECYPQPQDDTLATYTAPLKKMDGRLDFNQPASFLARKVRAYNPWPGTYTTWKDQILKIHHLYVYKGYKKTDSKIIPGSHMVVEGLPAIATKDGILLLDQLQLAGKRSLTGEEFLQGARDWDK